MHPLILKPVPGRGNSFCTSSLVSHSLGTRKGRALVRLTEFLMSMGNHHCLHSVFTIKLCFATAKDGMDRRKLFELDLTHLLKDGTSGSHFFLWFHTRRGFIPRPFGFEYVIFPPSKGLWNNLSYWNNVSYHHFVQCCPSLWPKLNTQEETRTSRRNDCNSLLNVLNINKESKISLLWESICIFQSKSFKFLKLCLYLWGQKFDLIIAKGEGATNTGWI